MTRTIAVTGSASGIGAATARLLREAGARVIGVDIRDAEVVCDLSTPQGRQAAVAGIQALSAGVLNGLVACAGLSTVSGDAKKMLSVNYFGTAELLLGLRPELARNAAPAAVAISSWALLSPDALPQAVEACLAFDEARAHRSVAVDSHAERMLPTYAASKLAVARLVRRLAPTADWAGAGITLNVLAPSAIRTPMIAARIATPEGEREFLKAVPSPMGIGEADDVAALAAFLVSGQTRYVTGQVIYVDGGLEAMKRPNALLAPVTEESTISRPR